jgi:hypothetical protein
MGDREDLEDAVFRVTPKEFTAARDALAAALKAAGKKDDAKAVKAWRRPPLPVWLWNRLILDGAESARTAVQAAAEVADAMAKSAPVARAVAALRAAGAQVVGEARTLAKQSGVGFSTAQERELTELVQALPWNDEVRDAAARGRLHDMPPAVDPLEAMRVLAGAPPAPPEPVEPAREADEAPLRQLKAEAEAARAALDSAESAHARAVSDAEKARAAVARVEKMLDETRARAEDAEREAGEQARAVAEARERCEAAQAALEDAEG